MPESILKTDSEIVKMKSYKKKKKCDSTKMGSHFYLLPDLNLILEFIETGFFWKKEPKLNRIVDLKSQFINYSIKNLRYNIRMGCQHTIKVLGMKIL